MILALSDSFYGVLTLYDKRMDWPPRRGDQRPNSRFAPRLLTSRAAKALGGLAALLVLACLIAGLALLPAGDVWAQAVDYDTDDDNLIEVSNLAQLNAIRWDLNGDGDPDSTSDDTEYFTAFTGTGTSLSCHGTCAGYELTADLDFDTDGSDDANSGDTYWNGGAGWTPIGFFSNTDGENHPYTATFDGKGHTISNLFIDQDTSSGADDPDNRGFGLFATTANGSEVRGVGLLDVDVTGRANTGSLIGRAEGRVYAVYATGSVTGAGTVGGLIAHTRSTAVVVGSWADVDVTANSNMGGLVGLHVGGDIIASYATGSVTVAGTGSDQDYIGGLVGSHRNEGSDTARIIASYSTGAVSNPGTGAANGLVGTTQGSPVTTNSYWDTTTSGTTSGSHGTGYVTSALQTPNAYGTGTSIYANWNVDVTGDSNADDPWDFGTSSQYPALRVDFDGNLTATFPEFGPQRRPGAPDGLAATVGNDGTNDTLTVTWTAPTTGSPPTGYQYRYDDSGDSDDTTWSHDWTDTTALTFTIGHPLADEYDIQVRAVNLHDDSPGSVATYIYPPAATDYDKDDDGLIEITNLEQLNAVRYDLDGDGSPASGSEVAYAVAFPDHVTGMGCPATCTGYELFNDHSSLADSFVYTAGDLDFDDTGSYASGNVNTAWTSSPGWEPIGDAANPFAARFYGNGYAVRNLFINRPTNRQRGPVRQHRRPRLGCPIRLERGQRYRTGQRGRPGRAERRRRPVHLRHRQR